MSGFIDREKANANQVLEALGQVPQTLMYSIPLVAALAMVDYLGTVVKDYLPTTGSVMQYRLQESTVNALSDVSKISVALQVASPK